MFVMELKLGPPLLPLCLAYPLCPPCPMTGVFSNCKYGCGTSKLLMVAARMHMARLSSYPVKTGYLLKTLHLATHSNVVRGLSTNSQDHKKSCGFCSGSAPTSPFSDVAFFFRCLW